MTIYYENAILEANHQGRNPSLPIDSDVSDDDEHVCDDDCRSNGCSERFSERSE